MKFPKIVFATFIICGALTAPQISTAKEAFKLSDNTGLFTIDFDFQAGNQTYRIPVGAVSELTEGNKNKYVGYTFEVGKRALSETKTNGLILSTQPIVDGYYEIKPLDRASFTLLVVATAPENTTMRSYKASIEHLPYFDGTEQKTVDESKLNDLDSESLLLNQQIKGDGYTVTIKTK